MKWKESMKTGGLAISAGLVVLGSSYAVMRKPERLETLKEMFTNKSFFSTITYNYSILYIYIFRKGRS